MDSKHSTQAPEAEHEHIHLPDPSIWPVVLAFGIMFFGYGIIYRGIPLLVGIVFIAIGLYGWIADLFRERREKQAQQERS